MCVYVREIKKSRERERKKEREGRVRELSERNLQNTEETSNDIIAWDGR